MSPHAHVYRYIGSSLFRLHPFCSTIRPRNVLVRLEESRLCCSIYDQPSHAAASLLLEESDRRVHTASNGNVLKDAQNSPQRDSQGHAEQEQLLAVSELRSFSPALTLVRDPLLCCSTYDSHVGACSSSDLPMPCRGKSWCSVGGLLRLRQNKDGSLKNCTLYSEAACVELDIFQPATDVLLFRHSGIMLFREIAWPPLRHRGDFGDDDLSKEEQVARNPLSKEKHYRVKCSCPPSEDILSIFKLKHFIVHVQPVPDHVKSTTR